MSYIGRGVDAISNVEKLTNITFDGSTTYNLVKDGVAFTPSGKNNILISIDGVVQQGNFTVAGSTIIFDWSPASSNTCNWIQHYGVGVLNTPADSSVNMAQLGASGTKSSSTFLAGDNTFKTIAGTTINTIKTATVQDDAITTDKLANSINTAITANTAKTGITSSQTSAITANTAKTTNATHSGEVTGATALTIADNIVDEANLKVSNSATNGHFLSAQSGNSGGLTWAEAGGGGKIGQVLQKFKADSFSTTSTSYTEISSFRQAITPSASNSKILVRLDLGVGMGAAGTYWLKLHRVIGSSHTNIGNNTIDGNEDAAWGSGIRGSNPDYELQSVNLGYLDSPSTTSEIEYYVVVRCDSSTVLVGQVGANTSRATTSVMTVMEVLA